MNHDVFISYSSQDMEAAQAICHVLEQNEIRCWMAPRNIPPGTDYGDVIDEAIKTCKVIVVIFSETAAESQWVKGELNIAFEEQKTIIPFRLDQTPLKGQNRVILNKTHWIDAYPHFADRLPDLLKSVSNLLGRSVKKVNVQVETNIEAKEEWSKYNGTITGSFNGHDYIDLGLPSGTLWATCNVGAKAPEQYGDHFSWGETQPKNDCGWNTYKFSKKGGFLKKNFLLTKYCNNSNYGYDGFYDQLTVLQDCDDAATVTWGNGWHMPSREQWEELLQYTKNTWTTRKNVIGRLFVANNGNTLFLPTAGCCVEGEFNLIGSNGVYWSSSLYTNDSHNAWDFYFGSGGMGMYDGCRCNGHSVRAVRSKCQN